MVSWIHLLASMTVTLSVGSVALPQTSTPSVDVSKRAPINLNDTPGHRKAPGRLGTRGFVVVPRDNAKCDHEDAIGCLTFVGMEGSFYWECAWLFDNGNLFIMVAPTPNTDGCPWS